MKKRNTVVILLLILGLISLTIGVSIAFFNYTRTGSENVLAVGRIYFNSSQGTAINLTNVFPVKSTELENNDNVSSVTLTITGDTTYDEGLEYLISADQVVNTVNSKQVPIGTSVTVSNLGTSDDSYFTNRGGNSSIYKVLSKGNIKEDGELVVGYITKGASGVNGSVTVSAWIDGDKLAISDTYDGTESNNNGTTNEWVGDRTVLTTTEWNSLQSSGVSFKLRVEANEGIWVIEPLTALDIIKKKVNTTSLIDFSQNSSDTNGKGVYILPGTESDSNPIYYYRGDVNDNNVVFGGYCWQMVRTTDTGGIKMIYNGLAKREVIIVESNIVSDTDINYTNDVEFPYSYDVNTKKWTSTNHTDNKTGTISFSVNSNGDYAIEYEISSERNHDKAMIYKNSTLISVNSGIETGILELGNITTEDIIKIEYKKDSSGSSGNDNYIFEIIEVTDKQETDNLECKNTIFSDKIIALSAFNSDYISMSDIGYMSNIRYPFQNESVASGVIFGKSVEWHNDHYLVIEDTENVPSTNTTKDDYHHYTCGTVTNGLGDTECSSIRYYYINNYYQYVTLTNGDTIEDALYKMTGNGSEMTRQKNNSYFLNQNDSTIKTVIEDWFKNNLTNEVNITREDYRKYIEDTVWCNDRGYSTTIGKGAYEEAGWNPNGGSLGKAQYFAAVGRYGNYSSSNVPIMTCSNKTDQFSVANKDAKLNYPVGLLTTDEIILAGASGRTNSVYSNYYLHTNDYYWLMSPSLYLSINIMYGANVYSLGNNGYIDASAHNNTSKKNGVRPAISLKPGIEFEPDGDGTPLNPYVVKYN